MDRMPSLAEKLDSKSRTTHRAVRVKYTMKRLQLGGIRADAAAMGLSGRIMGSEVLQGTDALSLEDSHGTLDRSVPVSSINSLCSGAKIQACV